MLVHAELVISHLETSHSPCMQIRDLKSEERPRCFSIQYRFLGIGTSRPLLILHPLPPALLLLPHYHASHEDFNLQSKFKSTSQGALNMDSFQSYATGSELKSSHVNMATNNSLHPPPHLPSG